MVETPGMTTQQDVNPGQVGCLLGLRFYPNWQSGVDTEQKVDVFGSFRYERGKAINLCGRTDRGEQSWGSLASRD
jgi:hypothetical protein